MVFSSQSQSGLNYQRLPKTAGAQATAGSRGQLRDAKPPHCPAKPAGPLVKLPDALIKTLDTLTTSTPHVKLRTDWLSYSLMTF